MGYEFITLPMTHLFGVLVDSFGTAAGCLVYPAVFSFLGSLEVLLICLSFDVW
jgi:hypothetical protein